MAGNNPQAAGGWPLPQWAVERLIRTFPVGQEPRYESPMYAVIGMLLNRCFPVVHRYMIAPQLIFIKTPQVDPDTSMEAQYGSSGSSSESEVFDYDNFGEAIPPRSWGRQPKNTVTNPDFVILKADVLNQMDHDWLCGLVEVKKSTRNLEQSRNQIRKYLDVVDTKGDDRVPKDFRAYLVLNGDTTEVYRQHEDPNQQQLPTVSTVELTGLCQALQGLCQDCLPL